MTETKTELEKNAIAFARKRDLDACQRAYDMKWLNDRMGDGKMGRSLALIQREADLEKDFQERTDHAAIVNAKAEKEIALGIAVAKVQREEACQLLRRHYLRERDPSLRELTKKLQAGSVCRHLQQQILQNEYRRLQDKALDQQSNDILLNAMYTDKEANVNEEKEKHLRTTQYRKDLQQQLVNRERERQCLYEDTLVEKKMLEDIMRTIADEDKRELNKFYSEREKMRNEMVTFKLAREAWRLKQREMVVREERHLEAEQAALADRSAAVIAAREQKVREKEALCAKICAKILADEAAVQQRTDIIKQLQEQEFLEKNVQDDLAAASKLERVKRETMRALTAQMDDRKKLAADQREKEAQFRKDAEAKMAADEEKEREKARKLKEKSRKYSEELLKQIQDNAGRRKRDQALEERRAQAVFDTEKAWSKEVTEERNKIIEEHVPSLLGYLQAGVIKKEELVHVRAGADREPALKGLDIEAMAVSARPPRFSKCNPQCRVLREY